MRPPSTSCSKSGGGHARTPRRHQDAIKRRLVEPTEGAIAYADPDVGVAEALQHGPRPQREGRDPLDRAHPAGQPGQDRRLVAGARADLQDFLAAAEVEQRRHEGHDVGLRDRLPLADRQGMIPVGALPKRLLDEEVARDPTHDGQHPLVRDPSSHELLVHHPLALALEEIGGAHGESGPSASRRALSQVGQSFIWAMAR